MKIADEFSISNADETIKKVIEISSQWNSIASKLSIPNKVIQSIRKDFNLLN
jgi:hypothetical protein